MVCEKCGKELIKIGELTKEEQLNYWFVNEKINTAYQALRNDVLQGMNFSDNQVFEYFRAAYDALAQARFLQFVFYRDLKDRLNTNSEIIIDDLAIEVFSHTSNDKKEE